MDDLQIAAAMEPADLLTAMSALAATGYVPYGGLVVSRNGELAQPMINRAPLTSTVQVILIATASRDTFRTLVTAQLAAGYTPTGTALVYRGSVICQAMYRISGVSEYATQIMRVVTSTGTQNITAANTPQPIVWDQVTEASPDVATTNLATGVLTFPNSFAGIVSFNARVQRNGALLSGASSWNIQVETSADGVVWTPFPGSRRNIAFNGGLATTVMNILVDGTFALRIPAGTRLRVTQFSEATSPTVGIAGTAASTGIASGYAAILSLMSTPMKIVV